MRQRILVALSIAAGGAAIAYAQTPPAPPVPPSGTDGPARAMHAPLTRTDAEKRVVDQFAALDLNHDGVVTRDEVAAARRTERDKMRAFVEARMKEGRERAFDRLDTNHDGSISRAEFAAAAPPPGRGPDGAGAPPPGKGSPRGPGPKGERMAGRGPAGRPGGPGPMMHGPMMGEHWFEQADANRDNKVTLAEAKAVALARFDRLDTNHDGTIEPEERRMAFRGGWRQHRGAPLSPPGDMPPPSHG